MARKSQNKIKMLCDVRLLNGNNLETHQRLKFIIGAIWDLSKRLRRICLKRNRIIV